MKVLVVEDEHRLAKALVHILSDAGYEAEAVYAGNEGLHYATMNVYDLIVLDVMLPGMDGFSVVRALRQQHNRVPVLMLTAKFSVSDKVSGLDAGADDYLTKPFDPEELLARIRALLRRGDNAVTDKMTALDLHLSVDTHHLSCGDRSIQLSSREYQIMRLLMNNMDRYLSKDELLLRAWDMATEAGDNCVEAYISFLRKKLGYLKSRTGIATLRKVGYRLEEKHMMLSKLRRRIVWILMAVFLVLIVGVVACVHAINVQQTVERQKEILRSAALQPMTRRASSQRTAEYRSGTPFFAVRFDPEGNVTSVYQFSFDISDNKATRAAERALRSDRTSGLLHDQQLRYLVRTDAEGYTRVTFISMAEDEAQQQKQLVYSLLIIPVLLILLFLIVALPLSRWLTKPAQNAWDAQRRFIADASHELKTPLTVILANLSILQKHPQQTIASCEGWLESTQQEAQQMRRLVEEMLMLARTEDEQPAAVFSKTHISELMEQAIMTIEPVAFENGVTLETDIEENITAVCSEMHIRQMMMILLDNAIKYAGGEKKVTVALMKKQERVELRVTNTGSPIPAEMLPHLFDRFYRGDTNRTSNGFGLGLAIAKQIAEMHKGQIQVTSSVEEGTTFFVLMPCKS